MLRDDKEGFSVLRAGGLGRRAVSGELGVGEGIR